MTPFDRFWNLYPHRKSKGEARKAWEKIEKDSTVVEQIYLSIDIQKRYMVEARKRGEFMPNWKLPATWLNKQCWEDEVPSISALRTKDEGSTKVCECGKPSMFGSSTPLNHCQACYMNYATDKGIAQIISKNDLYDAAKRHGFAKRKDESMEEYASRCKAYFQKTKTTAYLEAHAEFKERQ